MNSNTSKKNTEYKTDKLKKVKSQANLDNNKLLDDSRLAHNSSVSGISNASTSGSINGDYSGGEDNVSTKKQKLTGFAEKLNNTKINNKMGGGRPEEKYKHVATEILKLIDINDNDYSKENKDDFFAVVKSKMQNSIGSASAIKDDKQWRDEFDKVFQNSPKGKNFLGILETNAVDTEAMKQENLRLQDLLTADKKNQDLLVQKNSILETQAQEAKTQNATLQNSLKEQQKQAELEKQQREDLERQKKEKESALKQKDLELKVQQELAEQQKTMLNNLQLQMEASNRQALEKEQKIQELQNEMKFNGAEASGKNDALQKEIDRLKNEKTEAEKKASDLQDALTKEQQKAEDEKKNLQAEAESLKSKLEREESEKTDALKKNSEFEQKNTELEAKLKEFEQKISDLDSKIGDFESSATKKDEEIEALKQQKRQAEGLTKTQEEDLKRLEQEKQDLEIKMKEAEDEKEKLQTQEMEVRDELYLLQKNMDELQKDMDDLKGKNQAQEALLQNQKSELDEQNGLIKGLNVVIKDNKKIIDILDSDILDLKNRNALSLEQEESLRSDKEKLEAINQEKNLELANLSQKIEATENQIKAKEEEIARLEEDKKRIGEENTEELYKLNKQIGHLNDEKELLEKEKQKMAEEKLAAEKKNADLEKANSQQQVNIDNLNKELAEEKEKAKNQPIQQTQPKDITFEPTSEKDKFVGRVKEIGKSVADNMFIIAAMIGTIMALMTGAGIAVVIVAAVTPIAGMMVKKGIEMVSDGIKRSQKNKEREQILELNQQRLNQQQGPESQNIGQGNEAEIETQNQKYGKYQGGPEEEFNGSERDENKSTKGSEDDIISANNAKNGSEFDEDMETQSQITIQQNQQNPSGLEDEIEEIDDINKQIKKAKLGNLKDEEFDVEEKFNLDILQGKILSIDPDKKYSNIEGLDLDGAYEPQKNTVALSPEELVRQKTELKARIGYSPILQTNTQINALETQGNGGISVNDVQISLNEKSTPVQQGNLIEQNVSLNLNNNTYQQDIESRVRDIEYKDSKIRGFLKDKEKLEKQKDAFKEKAKSFNNRNVQLARDIEAENKKAQNKKIEIDDLKEQMEKAGITTESETLIGIVPGFKKIDREIKLKKKLSELDSQIAAVKAAQEVDIFKSTKLDMKEGRSKEYYDKKIQIRTEEIEKLMNEKTSLNTKNDEQNNLKNRMQELKNELDGIGKNQKKLNDEYEKLRSENVKLQRENNNIINKEKEADKGIDNRKEEIKKKAQEDAAKKKLQDENKAKALEAKKLQEEKKAAEKLQAIKKQKEEEYNKKLQGLKDRKIEANKKAGILSTAERKAAAWKLESEAWNKDHAEDLALQEKLKIESKSAENIVPQTNDEILAQEQKAQDDELKKKLEERKNSKAAKQSQGSTGQDNDAEKLLSGLINGVDMSGASSVVNGGNYSHQDNISQTSKKSVVAGL